MKEVDNSAIVANGLEPEDFILTADGPTPIFGPGGVASDVYAGEYQLSETNPGLYEEGPWICIGDGTQSGSAITLGVGESATCTITNTAIDQMGPSIEVTTNEFDLVDSTITGSTMIEKDKGVDDPSILITGISILVEAKVKNEWLVVGSMCTFNPDAPHSFTDEVTIGYDCTIAAIPVDAKSVRLTTFVSIFDREKVFSSSYSMKP